ncbi:Cytochrome P450 4C1 [Araneus ventricosus]|uniref:Cytochrome P450 4C1 n=1 Tax=Araneus ventricosus TaxID=182803 RepID=A0A4Y2LHR6_ARAVE|nr:Cytochrome P450 4C1 [Araneus ventricosus]
MTEILKRLVKNSIYDLNPQSIPVRDEMDGLKATYCGADFVPKKISGDEIYGDLRHLVHQLLYNADVNISTIPNNMSLYFHSYLRDILEQILGYDLIFQKSGFQCVWLGWSPMIAVYSPELLEVILSSTTSLEKSAEYSFLHRWLGHGLLTSTGPKWRSRRKLLTPCFHFRILDDFLPTLNDHSLVLVKKLQSLQDEDYVDITPLMVLCSLDIVCETVMGTQIGAQKGENSDYVTAVHSLGDFFNQRFVRPWLWFDSLFKISSFGRKFDRDLSILHNFTEKVIREKKKERMCQGHVAHDQVADDEIKNKRRRALMDLLLDLHFNGHQLSEEDIKEEVDTFMFEGHDTIAMGITFALYCIGLHPDLQRKIHEELDGIFSNNKQRPITMDDVRSMKYLECTIKESQRLYPSVPMIGRKLDEDIHYQGYVIPKGVTVHCRIIGMHRRDDIYENAEIFNPDRFMPQNVLKRHPYAFLPFSAGPRNCIGQRFAMLEEKVVISNILRHFRIKSLDPRDKFHIKIEFTLRPDQPVRLQFIPR